MHPDTAVHAAELEPDGALPLGSMRSVHSVGEIAEGTEINLPPERRAQPS